MRQRSQISATQTLQSAGSTGIIGCLELLSRHHSLHLSAVSGLLHPVRRSLLGPHWPAGHLPEASVNNFTAL